MSDSGSDIVTELVDLPPHKQLEEEWLELEARSDCSFFTSWSWIGCWLSCLPVQIKPRLLRATRIRDKKVLGLGLLVCRRFLRHRFFPVKGLFLHATGDPLFDEIAIEYNGFLVDQAMQSVTIPRLLEYLVALSDDWDELHIDGVAETATPQFQGRVGLQVLRRQDSFSYVDLAEIRLDGGDYLSMLGQSTRYNVRRSVKEFAKQGPVALTVANGVEEALEFLVGLKKLHQTHWRSRGLRGSFENSFFETFHDKLIRSRFNTGEIQLARTSAGGRVVGYLYNFLHRNMIHSYQTGFDYTICKKQYSPGLVTHSMAIEYNMSRGYRVYDLMAGDSQYKRAICTHTGKMDWIVLRRDRLKFRIEDGLRHFKHKLYGGGSGAGG